MHRGKPVTVALLLAVPALAAGCAPDEAVTPGRPAATLLTDHVRIVDGTGQLPLNAFFDAPKAQPPALNVASYAGHNTIRSRVMGSDYRRVATAEEIDAMAGLLQEEFRSGALGLSTGLEYDPGIYSDPSEVLPLAKVAAEAGGRYISHVRSEDRWFEQALDEIIEIGRVTGMPVQVSHVKLAMKRLWGEAPRILAKLDAAEQAVHRMTGLAAAHMGFEDRGVIRASARADLVLFDPDTVIDRATRDSPERLSDGIRAVWVAGKRVFGNGRPTGNRPGTIIARAAP